MGLVDLYNLIVDFFQSIDDFIKTDIYEFFVKWFAEFVKWAVVAMIKFKIVVLKFAWDVAKEILLSLNLSQYLTAAYGSLDSRLVQFLAFFRVPESINIFLSAHVTRFVMRFMGF